MKAIGFVHHFLSRGYEQIFDYVSEVRRNKYDFDPSEIHIFLSIFFTSGLIMWGYTFIALFTMSSYVPIMIGLICSSVHALTPLLFRFTHKSFIPTNVLLSSAIIHEISYTHFYGGFLFNKLYWLGVFPLIAGVISGKRGIITWGIICLSVAVFCLFFQNHGYYSERQISEFGIFLSQGMLVLGQLIMTSTIIWVYAEQRKQTESLLQNQNKKIDDLFRVLFHDLANPLGRISLGLMIAKRELPPDIKVRGLDIAKDASDSMMEITYHVRKMYSLNKNKGELDLIYIPLRDSMDYILKIFSLDLEKKKITISFSDKEINSLQLLVDPISFNNQVLGNIISNAIKFSPEQGLITISVTLLPIGLFKIDIKDHGIGIPPEIMTDLFNINKKTSRPGTIGERGSGFGLHIAKSFVEIYGGSIEVESFEGGSIAPSGTTIKLFLKGKYV